MKPSQREAALRRKVARWARKIPDNATLLNMIHGIPELPRKRDFYFSIAPFLKFKPIPWEDLHVV